MKGFIALVCFFFCAIAVRSQPVISAQPQALTVNAGSTASFTVSSTDNAGAVTFQWQRNGANLSDGGTISGSATSNLVINPVALGDGGTYTVIANAGDGSTTSSQAPLTVLQGTIVDLQISGFSGGASNLVIELFDHDKPATVQNFIHYITSGAYTNMFFDRLIPNFIIQGGDWSTSNRTSTTPGLDLIGGGIEDFYVTQGEVTNPPLPAQVASEFSVGPFISNTYGTMAMALLSGDPNSASSAFFINLGDNSANLDYQTGGFTVFGRVLNASSLMINGVSFANAGTNLLNYLNNTNYFTGPAAGIFDGASDQNNLTNFASLPVNYDGTMAPADDNLFYADFTFLTNSAGTLSGPVQPPVDTIPPTVSIAYPTGNLILTNGAPLVVQGTASDNVGLALVKMTMLPLNGANGSNSFGFIATGTAFWSADVGSFAQPYGGIPVGDYNVQAVAQDGAGNLSVPALQPLVITAILTNGYGSVSATNTSTLAVITNAVGGALQDGYEYTVTATPGNGQLFLNWSGLGSPSVNPSVSFVMSQSTLLTATFLPNDFPGTVAFTYPPPGVQLTNNNFEISGTLSGAGSAQLTLQLFSQSTGNAVSQPVTISAASQWSLAITNLAAVSPGSYTIQVLAKDSQGDSTVISETFAFSSPGLLQTITSQPQNVTVNAGSAATFAVVAIDTNGPLSYQWEFNGVNLTDGGEISGSATPELRVSPPALSDAGAYTVAVSSADGLVNSQPALLTVLQGTIVNFQFSGFAGGASNVVVELFDHDKPATVENFIHYITSGAYRNMFFERLLPGFILQGGDWSTVDRTNGKAPIDLLSADIYDYYVTDGRVLSPPLPQQVDSEFNYGPFISNTYGTLAMALQAGNPDSAANGFFFNLADNSTNLDAQDGGFTVFGRVVGSGSLSIGGTNLVNAGTNLLNYFNDTNIFTTNSTDTASSQIYSNSQFATLPVNYAGANPPADTNLFYVDFTFLSNSLSGLAGPAVPPVHTNLPTATVTSPGGYAVFTNGATLVVEGTATDNVGLARVYCALFPQNGANGSVPFGGDAIGTTDWSYNFTTNFGNVPPGVYNIYAVSQDGAGNISTAVQLPITVTAIVINGNGTVTVTDISTGTSTASAIGAPLQNGVDYATRAAPAAGQQFLNWTGLGDVSIAPSIEFQMANKLLVTANFVSNNFPGSFAITYPPAKGQITNNDFMVTGNISGVSSAQVSYQLFSQSTGLAIGQSVTVSNASSWSAPVTNLATLEPGQYILQGLASDGAGHTTVVTNGFTLMARLNLVTNGAGTIALTPSSNPSYPYVVPGSYSAKAVAKPGTVFYSWSDGVNVSLNPVETITVANNTTLTATFVSNDLPAGLKFTYPTVNAKITNPTFSAAGKASSSATNITLQLFSQSSKLAVGPAMSVAPSALAWSLPVTNLPPGNYTAVAVAHDSQGRSSLVSENFDLLALLNVQYQGGSISPNLNGEYLVVGQQYTVKAVPKSGLLFNKWTGGVSSQNNPLTFTMTSNLTLTANFAINYFANIQGTYYGLYYPASEVSPTNSGYFTLKLTPTGSFTGYMTYSGRNVALGGSFRADGTQELIGAVGNVEFLVAMNLDLTNGTGTLTGAVTNFTSSYLNWTANLTAYLGVTKPANSGKFVFTIDGDPSDTTVPAGNGYATMSIGSTGLITLGGTLADNTPFSQTVGISKEGLWPLYAPLYSSEGSIFGWQSNSSPSTFSGSVSWVKPGLSSATYYRNGFATNLNSSANSFSPPVAGSQYVMTIGGGTIAGTLTNLLTVSSTGQFVPQANSDKLSITLVTTTGVLSGHFLDPVTGKTVSIKGAFASPSAGGSGFTLDSNGETGYFQLGLAPAPLLLGGYEGFGTPQIGNSAP